MEKFLPGDRVQILEGGSWSEPFTVTDLTGRTPEHLVLFSRGMYFEHYNDAPFNTRKVEA